MASKKQSLLIAVMCLLAVSGMSQVGVGSGIYNYYDSSLIPKSRTSQHNEFLNQVSSYPAKPRNQWEVGVGLGMFTVSGDVPAVLPTGGFTVHVRKSLGYLFSLRLQYLYGIGKGLHWLEANNYMKNSAWASRGYQGHLSYTLFTTPPVPNQLPNSGDRYFRPSRERIFYNYKTNVQDLGLQGVLTLNNVRFHKRKTSAIIYGIAGIGASVYETKVDALNASGGRYTFSQTTATHPTRKSTLSALKTMLDGDYETLADNHGARRPKLFGKTLKPSGTVGVGAAFKLGKRINLSIEDRHTFIKDDLLDGQRWQEHAQGDAVMTRDFDSYNMLSVGLNVNLGARSVEPLWWLNPLDYAYTELPNRTLAKFKYNPKDGDGDGVQDEMDKEPNTPAGCPVDTHGVTRDTDGDGVPDCKDKELITPTQCQPVDADGIGKCPEPECCSKTPPPPPNACNFSAPAVEFSNGSCNLSADAKDALNTLASDMKANAGCNVNITARGESKAMQKLADCRAGAIKKYLVSKGVSESRINTSVDQTSDSNTADIEVSGGM